MFYTSEYFLTSEIAYRHERIRSDWSGRRTRRPTRSRPLRLRRRPALLPGTHHAGGATLA